MNEYGKTDTNENEIKIYEIYNTIEGKGRMNRAPAGGANALGAPDQLDS